MNKFRKTTAIALSAATLFTACSGSEPSVSEPVATAPATVPVATVAATVPATEPAPPVTVDPKLADFVSKVDAWFVTYEGLNEDFVTSANDGSSIDGIMFFITSIARHLNTNAPESGSFVPTDLNAPYDAFVSDCADGWNLTAIGMTLARQGQPFDEAVVRDAVETCGESTIAFQAAFAAY